MKWICLSCGRKNESADIRCTKCGLDQEVAMTTAVAKRMKICEDCGHKHQDEVYCHVYVEGLGEGDMEEENDIGQVTESDSEKSVSEESDDSSTARRKKRQAAKKGKENPKKDEKEEKKITKSVIALNKKVVDTKKIKPLDTPAYCKAIGYIRCNCKVGIPKDSARFEPLPKIVFVGKIQIETYFEINDPRDRYLFLENLKLRVGTDQMIEKLKLEKLNNIGLCIPHILSYLPYGLCCFAPQVSSYWNMGTNLYKEYIDIRNCVPMQIYRPHQSQVDSIVVYMNKVYTGGDKRILVSSLTTGEVLAMVTRDSGDITRLAIQDNDLVCCSSNGSVRTFGLTHTGQNMPMVATMWDHTKPIVDLVTSLPSHGACVMHGIENHVCCMYTASSDRTVKKTNLARMQAIRTIQSPSLRTATFTRVTQSPRHIFVGTSMATVAVFNKDVQPCEREDIHQCHVPGYSQAYCLQITLRLPKRMLPSGNPPSITGLIAPKIGPEFPTLWAADATGQLTIWYIPLGGLEFQPAFTKKMHSGTINQMSQTWRHMITIGSDSKVLLIDIITFVKIRTIDIMEWGIYRNLLLNSHIPRKLNCVHILENYDTGGTMAIGSSYGEIIVMPLGTTV